MLETFRKEIDKIDTGILSLFSERSEAVHKIGAYKREHGLPLEDVKREEQILRKKAHSPEEKDFLISLMRISKCMQKKCFNIYLIGMPYSGKTTLLHSMASSTNRNITDTDSMVEKIFGIEIPEIFQKNGETAFRKAETSVLKECAKLGSMIVSTGGGILTQPENIPILKNSGIVVLCERPLEDLCASYEMDPNSRPLIHSRDELELLYFERFKAYRENADLIVDTRKSSCPDEILLFAKEKGLSV